MAISGSIVCAKSYTVWIEQLSHLTLLSDSIIYVFSPSSVRKPDMGLFRLRRNQYVSLGARDS
jgi:hypothetical protein